MITNPDDNFEFVTIDTNAIYFGGARLIGILPNLPIFCSGALQGSECDTLSTSIPSALIKEVNVFTVFPNPASTILQIETESVGRNVVIIRNASGSLCYSGNFTGSMQLPVLNFANGIYSICILNEETGVWFTEKWVKM